MTDPGQAKARETRYEDHSVIVPPHRLKTAILHTPEPGDVDMAPVERAQEALDTISHEFTDWMQAECDALEAARAALRAAGPTPTAVQRLFRASHDIKGDAATFGYPLAGRLAGCLCRLIDNAPNRRKLPPALIDRFVEAIRAVVREKLRDAASPAGSEVAEQLAILVEKFLAAELKDGYAEIAGDAYVRIDLPGKA